MPLANPAAAAIVSSPRIFQDLVAPPRHGLSPDGPRGDRAPRLAGGLRGRRRRSPDRAFRPHREPAARQQLVEARGGTGAPTAADSAALRERLPQIAAQMAAERNDGPQPGPTQCHDITRLPGRSGWPVGRARATDSCSTSGTRSSRRASARWPTPTSRTGTRRRSTTTAPRCSSPTSGAVVVARSAARPTRWSGAPTRSSPSTAARWSFQSYYKLPAPQTSLENCVAHNGSLIPIPGRDMMVQSWYQGGHLDLRLDRPGTTPFEIAFHDRGPSTPTAGRRAAPGRCIGTTACS